MKALLLFLLSVTMASAQYQKLDAPVNDEGRTLSFHLYHFDAQKNPEKLHTKPKTISSAVHQRSHLATGEPPPFGHLREQRPGQHPPHTRHAAQQVLSRPPCRTCLYRRIEVAIDT